MVEESQSESRRPRRRAESKAIAQEKLVETTNSLRCEDFFQRYGPENLPAEFNHGNGTGSAKRAYDDASTIPNAILEQCLDLIETTSADDYRASETGWSRARKRKEMKLPDMKYIVVLTGQHPGRIAGFVSFMVTYEDGYEVIYVYEIHLALEWQAQGLGKLLMEAVESIGKKVGLSKIMLTVFKANTRAVNWYIKIGYTEDEFSPSPRTLRNGTVKQPTYTILSKSLKG